MASAEQNFRVPMGRDVIMASLVTNVLALSLPLVLLQIYDRIIPNQGYSTLIALAIGLFLAIVLDVVLKYSRSQIMSWTGARFERDLAGIAVRRLLKGDLAEIEKTAPGGHVDRLNSIDRIKEFRTGEAAVTFLDIPFAFLFLFIIALIAPLLAALVLGIVIIGVFFRRRIDAKARTLIEERSLLDTRRNSFLIEVLRSIETIKSLGIAEFMERRYERLLGTSATVGARSGELSHLSQGIAGSLSQLTTALVACIGALLVINSEMTVGSLAAAILLAGRVLQPIFRMEAANGKLEDLQIWERRLADLLSTRTESTGTVEPEPIETVSLDAVSFQPVADAPAIFESISLDMKVGEIIAIRGESGTGKSILMWMLAGGVKPTSGRVLMNGKPFDDFNLMAMRQQIAMLSQKHALLDGTIIENMTRFDPDSNANDALFVASALGLDSFFASRPEGLSAKVRSGSSAGFPKSIVDRIAMTRALVGSPRLILFDEANQALDRDADERLMAYLKSQKPNAAIVLVTQRPSYMAMADRTFELADGCLQPVSLSAPQSHQQAPVQREMAS